MGFTIKGSRTFGDFDLGLVYQRGYAPSPIMSGFSLKPLAEEVSVPSVAHYDQGYLPLQK